MLRRSTIVASGVLLTLLLVPANFLTTWDKDWASSLSPQVRGWGSSFWSLAAFAYFELFHFFSAFNYVLAVASVALVISVFTRADRLRLCAAAILLSGALSSKLVYPTESIVHTARLHVQRARMGAAITDFVRRHDRAPANLPELYPNGGGPSFACDDPNPVGHFENSRIRGSSEPREPDARYRPGVALCSSAFLSTPGMKVWRFDPRTETWSTERLPSAFSTWHPPLGGSSLSHSLEIITALLIIAAAYRPWRRLGEQQRASIEPEKA